MDIKKAIEKLNSIDAKDLKNIDLSKLKQIDIGVIKEELMTKPKLLINSIFIGIAVIAVIVATSSYSRTSSDVKTSITELEEKLEIIKKRDAAQAAYNNFFEDFPETIPNNQLIGKISEFSEATDINIVSFSPVKTNETDFVTQLIVNLSIEADSYQNLIDFIYIIENSGYTLRVNKWFARTKNRLIGQYEGEGGILIEAFIEIGSIKLRDKDA